METKNSIINEKITARRKLIKSLWKKAHDVMTFIYGDMPDVRILNRFYSEKMQFGDKDHIIMWDLAADIRLEAKEKGHLSTLSGTDASCLTSYLIGASDSNPLELHYRCSECKRTEFLSKNLLPWDISDKPCECGGVMRADGFDVPCEMHTPGRGAPWPHITMAPAFMNSVESIIREKMGGLYRICKLTKPGFEILKFAFLPFDGEPDFEEDVDTVDDKYDMYPQITIVSPFSYDNAKKLSEVTGMDFDEVRADLEHKYLSDPRIILAFAKADIGGVLHFDLWRHPHARDLRNELRAANPKNNYDLLKYFGVMHGTGSWWGNAEVLIKEDTCSIGEIPAHRDDVFMALRDKLREAGHTDTGIAFNITTKARRGVYAREGIAAEDRAVLEYLDLPKWFATYLEKVQYMSPKSHSVENLRIALVFMWYKINYPEIFAACIESKLPDEE